MMLTYLIEVDFNDDRLQGVKFYNRYFMRQTIYYRYKFDSTNYFKALSINFLVDIDEEEALMIKLKENARMTVVEDKAKALKAAAYLTMP